MKQEHRKDTW